MVQPYYYALMHRRNRVMRTERQRQPVEAAMRMHATALIAGVILSTSLLLPAWAQSESAPIGKVVKLNGSVSIEHVGAVVVAASVGDNKTKIGDPVYRGDTVQTGANSAVGITFTDGSAFNLTSNARMVLNEFVYDPNGKSNSTFFSLTKGTFTFVAGKVAKTGDMKVDTPVATMGIRGTTPHVEISENGTVKFSTLIEEGKSKVEKRSTLLKQSPKAAQQSPPIAPKPNFTLCRGC
jgi:hypothetical protein